MRRKVVLSVVLSAAMVLGSAFPVSAAGQMPSNEVTAGIETTVSEPRNAQQTEQPDRDDSSVNSGQGSVDSQEMTEEGEAGTEAESEETDMEAGAPYEENKSDTAAGTSEEEKPEPLVGSEGARISVGTNVTAGFDSQTGMLTFYSQGGTLSKEWVDMLGINKDDIRVITISEDSDVMYLPADSFRLFESFANLQSLDLSKADTSNVTDMAEMFAYCSNLQTLDVSGFDTSNATRMFYMFFRCSALQTLDVSGFDTSNVTTMYDMFARCSNLQTLDVSGFDTSKVTDMGSMFAYCNSLQMLDVSRFDTSKVTIMAQMFEGCSSLQALDVSGFDTSKIPSMHAMFRNCSSLQVLDVSGFDTSKATTMYAMFGGCSSLQALDVSGFNTSNVTNMGAMFSGCSSLQTLDLSGFNASNVKYVRDPMFDGCDFDILLTPVNLKLTVALPGTYIDASGTEYNSLPEDISESIRLTKKGAELPADLTVLSISDDYYGVNGTKASFHIEAEGSGTIAYQWQYRTAGTTGWKTPSQASAKTADYVFNLKPSYDNIEIRCIVSDDSGNEVVSETRKANVFAITSQPSDATAEEGQLVEFKVSAIGKGVTYQWYYMRPNGTWNKTTVSGSKTAVLPITAGTKNDGTSYRCVIADEDGNRITSAAGLLMLDNALRITDISDNVYEVSGKNVTFHVDAEGKSALSYQWQYKLAGESVWRTPGQASAKSADYTFKLKRSYDNIEVRCIVTDAAGNTCTSDVRKANVFAITKQPELVFAELGERVTFSVEGIGQNLTYQWYYRQLEGGWKKVTDAGADTASLTITAKVENNVAQYRCYVYDGVGNLIKSQAAMLIEENEEYEG